MYSEHIIIDDIPIESIVGENSSKLADNDAELLKEILNIQKLQKH